MSDIENRLRVLVTRARAAAEAFKISHVTIDCIEEAAATIARLEAENAQYKEDYSTILQASRDNEELLKELLAENARLREAALEYLKYPASCDGASLSAKRDLKAALAEAQPASTEGEG